MTRDSSNSDVRCCVLRHVVLNFICNIQYGVWFWFSVSWPPSLLEIASPTLLNAFLFIFNWTYFHVFLAGSSLSCVSLISSPIPWLLLFITDCHPLMVHILLYFFRLFLELLYFDSVSFFHGQNFSTEDGGLVQKTVYIKCIVCKNLWPFFCLYEVKSCCEELYSTGESATLPSDFWH